jgi:hypothetical protein
MKKLSLLFILLLSATSHAENIPGPFWYTLSEKILAETQQLFSLDDAPVKTPAKPKAKKSKVAAVPLKCQPKKTSLLPNPFPVATIKTTAPDVD